MKQRHWKSSEEYNYVYKLSERELAWEFLRRNKHYNKKYEEYLSVKKSGEIEHKGTAFLSKQEKMRAYAEIAQDKEPLGISAHYARPFWLSRMVSPKKEYEDGVLFLKQPVAPYALKYSTDLEPYCSSVEIYDEEARVVDDFYLISERLCGFVFDASLPIGPQIEVAGRTLENIRDRYKINEKRFRKPDIELYKRHIRVLDALEAKVPRGEITEEFGRSDQSGDSDYEQSFKYTKPAKRMAEDGYKNLLVGKSIETDV